MQGNGVDEIDLCIKNNGHSSRAILMEGYVKIKSCGTSVMPAIFSDN